MEGELLGAGREVSDPQNSERGLAMPGRVSGPREMGKEGMSCSALGIRAGDGPRSLAPGVCTDLWCFAAL